MVTFDSIYNATSSSINCPSGIPICPTSPRASTGLSSPGQLTACVSVSSVFVSVVVYTSCSYCKKFEYEEVGYERSRTMRPGYKALFSSSFGSLPYWLFQYPPKPKMKRQYGIGRKTVNRIICETINKILINKFAWIKDWICCPISADSIRQLRQSSQMKCRLCLFSFF